VFLSPKVRGVAWQLGAIGNAEWTGVALGDILSRAGLRKSAVEIVLEGADRGSVNDDPKSPGPIAFARSLPVEKALKPEVLLAHSVNGRPLPAEHGAPLRAVVGGWYGMASVKWLTRILAVEAPFAGYWQTMDYSYFRRVDGLPVLTSIGEMQVKSAIARPATGESVPRDSDYRIFGAAWAGEAAIARVDISVDGGAHWSPATLIDRAAPFCWRFWEYRWRTPSAPGRVRLLARATDSRGRVQPMDRNPDLRTYLIHHAVPVDVVVR
jgi:DMSO/TMAO reductase YedYZ molybdopterin-dependent catalytic subunit